ncbi:hypothetical protein ASPCAL04222 [Aspergillus calidoustus]|uniref:2EXR domain-containing protein n=1 Tax=Aspergillus calidoustus TaxID=454130 RepID=A0A0U5FY23_ASPCI|nr:hypothetical protein ASPCAL04222 [Aspergillus calidoustus]
MEDPPTATRPFKFPSCPRLPAEIRPRIWETNLDASPSEPILATVALSDVPQPPILCTSPLLAVNHEARCAALSWAPTHRQRHKHEQHQQYDLREGYGYQYGHELKKKLRIKQFKMEEFQLERHPGSFFRPASAEVDVHFCPPCSQTCSSGMFVVGSLMHSTYGNAERYNGHSIGG